MEVPKPILVAVGGMVGATARWGVLEVADEASWALVAVNTVGAFVLGLLIRRVADAAAPARLLMGVGFCGALTTFSSLALDLATDLDRGAPGDAALLLVISVAAGLAGVIGGGAVVREAPAR